MYAISVNGSPRAGGNTEILHQEAVDQLAENGWQTELVQVGGTAIRGCLDCYKCFENKDLEFIIKNDGFYEIFSKILRSVSMILGSTTYFAAV